MIPPVAGGVDAWWTAPAIGRRADVIVGPLPGGAYFWEVREFSTLVTAPSLDRADGTSDNESAAWHDALECWLGWQQREQSRIDRYRAPVTLVHRDLDEVQLHLSVYWAGGWSWKLDVWWPGGITPPLRMPTDDSPPALYPTFEAAVEAGHLRLEQYQAVLGDLAARGVHIL